MPAAVEVIVFNPVASACPGEAIGGPARRRRGLRGVPAGARAAPARPPSSSKIDLLYGDAGRTHGDGPPARRRVGSAARCEVQAQQANPASGCRSRSGPAGVGVEHAAEASMQAASTRSISHVPCRRRSPGLADQPIVSRKPAAQRRDQALNGGQRADVDGASALERRASGHSASHDPSNPAPAAGEGDVAISATAPIRCARRLQHHRRPSPGEPGARGRGARRRSRRCRGRRWCRSGEWA